jgi:hypothetical protein
MGQQQLLLIILASLITGAAILLGVTLFQQNAGQANMDAVMQDCLTIATKTRAWYNRPSLLGGGGHDFTSISFVNLGYSADPYENENGSYSFGSITANSVEVIGDGKESLDGDTIPLKIIVTVSAGTTPLVTTIQK